jgi:hypothetical protein
MQGSDNGSGLSESLGIDTIEERSMVPNAYRNALPRRGKRAHGYGLNDKLLLRIDHAANIRMSSSVSKSGNMGQNIDSQAFSSGWELIRPKPNHLSDDIPETLKLLEVWWDSGIARQLWLIHG